MPHLSLQAPHRRGWGSLYDALAAGRIDVAALRAFLRRHATSDGQPSYAVDLSVWPRCDAEASPERGFSCHPSRHSAGQPIVAGWAYQWLAQLSSTRDSWTDEPFSLADGANERVVEPVGRQVRRHRGKRQHVRSGL